MNTSAIKIAKSVYIGFFRSFGLCLDRLGVMAKLEQRKHKSRTAHWICSLFAIYDIDALIKLDVPWWTYDAIEEIEKILETKPNATVFEYGSGASTVWLARRAKSVTSVEHHPDWHAHVRTKLETIDGLAPVDLRLVEVDKTRAHDDIYLAQKEGEKGSSFENYAREISNPSGQLYDIIVIDGRARSACLKHAVTALSQDGVIVFDNSHRKRYQRAINSSGMSAKKFRGLTPALLYPDETTILELRSKKNDKAVS